MNEHHRMHLNQTRPTECLSVKALCGTKLKQGHIMFMICHLSFRLCNSNSNLNASGLSTAQELNDYFSSGSSVIPMWSKVQGRLGKKKKCSAEMGRTPPCCVLVTHLPTEQWNEEDHLSCINSESIITLHSSLVVDVPICAGEPDQPDSLQRSLCSFILELSLPLQLTWSQLTGGTASDRVSTRSRRRNAVFHGTTQSYEKRWRLQWGDWKSRNKMLGILDFLKPFSTARFWMISKVSPFFWAVSQSKNTSHSVRFLRWKWRGRAKKKRTH